MGERLFWTKRTVCAKVWQGVLVLSKVWQGVLVLSMAWEVHGEGKDIRLEASEEGPCGLGSGTFKSSHKSERTVGSRSQGHTR